LTNTVTDICDIDLRKLPFPISRIEDVYTMLDTASRQFHIEIDALTDVEATAYGRRATITTVCLPRRFKHRSDANKIVSKLLDMMVATRALRGL